MFLVAWDPTSGIYRRVELDHLAEMETRIQALEAKVASLDDRTLGLVRFGSPRRSFEFPKPLPLNLDGIEELPLKTHG